MAHKRPWYKRSGGDFVMAVLHFPDNDHRWAYSSIIDILNDRDMPIPDDPAFICGITSLPKQRWKKVRAYLLEHDYLSLTSSGHITNPRFEREQGERAGTHEKAVQFGREGGLKSAAARAKDQGELHLSESPDSKKLEESYQLSCNLVTNLVETNSDVFEAEPNKNNDLDQAPPQATRARKRLRDKRREESLTTTTILDSRAQSFDPLELSDHLTRIAGVRNIDPQRIFANAEIVKEWIALNISPDQIEQAIAQARDNASTAIHSLKYFDSKIRTIAAKQEHPNNATHPNQQRQIADPLLRRFLENGGTLDG